MVSGGQDGPLATVNEPAISTGLLKGQEKRFLGVTPNALVLK